MLVWAEVRSSQVSGVDEESIGCSMRIEVVNQNEHRYQVVILGQWFENEM